MNKMNKRDFLKLGMTGVGSMCILENQKISAAMNYLNDEKLWKWSREAIYYTQTPRGVKCLLCPNECTIRSGNTGICKNHVNLQG